MEKVKMYGDKAIGSAALGRGQDVAMGLAQEDRRLRDRQEVGQMTKAQPGIGDAMERLMKATSAAEETLGMLCSRLEPMSLSAPPMDARTTPSQPERPVCDMAQALQVLGNRIWVLQAKTQDALQRLDF
jgi:hypothetical protein